MTGCGIKLAGCAFRLVGCGFRLFSKHKCGRSKPRPYKPRPLSPSHPVIRPALRHVYAAHELDSRVGSDVLDELLQPD